MRPCQWSGVAIVTASIDLSSRSRRKSFSVRRVLPPVEDVDVLTGLANIASSMSQTATTSAPGSRREELQVVESAAAQADHRDAYPLAGRGPARRRECHQPRARRTQECSPSHHGEIPPDVAHVLGSIQIYLPGRAGTRSPSDPPQKGRRPAVGHCKRRSAFDNRAHRQWPVRHGAGKRSRSGFPARRNGSVGLESPTHGESHVPARSPPCCVGPPGFCDRHGCNGGAPHPRSGACGDEASGRIPGHRREGRKDRDARRRPPGRRHLPAGAGRQAGRRAGSRRS